MGQRFVFVIWNYSILTLFEVNKPEKKQKSLNHQWFEFIFGWHENNNVQSIFANDHNSEKKKLFWAELVRNNSKCIENPKVFCAKTLDLLRQHEIAVICCPVITHVKQKY